MASDPQSPPSPHAAVPTAMLALPATSRRLPPPCWTPDETAALIYAYRDKWYALRRGNLRANHWQEVAADVASRCAATPPKTAVQCRHKMEKLRKRYRAEIQRATASRGGPRRFSSPWVHFQSMYSMERGSDPSPSSSSSSSDDRRDHMNRINDVYNYNNENPREKKGTPGFGIKIPQLEEIGQSRNSKKRASGHGMAAAIEALGKGFMRIEKVKMEMVQEMEEMRMEMELKRTESILDSQQRIMEAFAKAISVKKAKKLQFR